VSQELSQGKAHLAQGALNFLDVSMCQGNANRNKCHQNNNPPSPFWEGIYEFPCQSACPYLFVSVTLP